MFISQLDSVTAEGNKISRIYCGETEKLSVWFATNLWATYDRDHGERLVDISTYDDYDTYEQYKARGEKMSRPDYWLVEDKRRLCTAHPSDIEAHK